jgi:hypothetical protein
MLFDLVDELVGFFLSHLSTAYHILYEVACALDDEPAESGGGIYDVFHGCRHFASGFQADFVGFSRHLGDSVLDVSAAVTGAPFWRDRGCAVDWCGRGRGLGRFIVLSHHSLLIY